MVETVPRQRRVVRFDVHFNLFFQAELLQEAVNRRHIVIILMLGRLLRLRLDQQGALETGFMFMLHHHLHKAAKLLALLAQIGVQQGFIAFAPAPQYVVFTAELVRRLHRAAHLARRPGEHFWIGIGGGASAVARMGKAVGGAP